MKKHINKERLQAQFTFPPTLFDLQTVSSPLAAREVLLSQGFALDLPPSSISYRIRVQKQRYLYLNCGWTNCRASLRYRLQENGQWKLFKAKCLHVHVVPTCRNKQFGAVRDYLRKIPVGVPVAALKKVVCLDFGITQKQFYYLLAKDRDRPLNIEQLTVHLEERGYQVYLSEEQRAPWNPPDMLVATNSEMKRLALQYGDLVSFDLSFNLIKNEHKSGKKWKIGVFLGTSSAKRIVPLALVAMVHQTSEAFNQLFKTYFRALGQPQVIVTDQERGIKAALAELKEKGQWDGLHLFDAFHILHNARKRLDRREGIVYFARLLHARNEGQFRRRQEEARINLGPQEKPVLDRFLQRSQLYCFSQIPPRFISFCSSSSPNQAFHSLFKKMQTTEKEFSLTIRNLAACAEHLLGQCHRFDQDITPYERIFGIPELRLIRSVLSKPVLSKFIEELAKSLKMQTAKVNEDEMVLGEHRQLTKVKKVGDLWRCSCLYLQKSQLPCRHILKILLCKAIPIIDYLPQRWQVKEEKQANQTLNPPALQRGREKVSKRKVIF